MASPAPDEPTGLTCPLCKLRLRTTHTTHLVGKVVRRKACRKCPYKTKTVEQTEGRKR